MSLERDLAELGAERYETLMTWLEKLESEQRRMSLVQDQILTRLLALKPAEAPPVQTPRPVASLELTERAALLCCPKCNGDVAVRFRKSDGNPFFGCKGFPDCNGVLPGTAQPTARALAQQAKLNTPITRPPRPPVRNAAADDDSVPF